MYITTQTHLHSTLIYSFIHWYTRVLNLQLVAIPLLEEFQLHDVYSRILSESSFVVGTGGGEEGGGGGEEGGGEGGGGDGRSSKAGDQRSGVDLAETTITTPTPTASATDAVDTRLQIPVIDSVDQQLDACMQQAHNCILQYLSDDNGW